MLEKATNYFAMQKQMDHKKNLKHIVFLSKCLRMEMPLDIFNMFIYIYREMVYSEIYNLCPVSFLLESEAWLEDLTQWSQKIGSLNIGPPK